MKSTKYHSKEELLEFAKSYNTDPKSIESKCHCGRCNGEFSEIMTPIEFLSPNAEFRIKVAKNSSKAETENEVGLKGLIYGEWYSFSNIEHGGSAILFEGDKSRGRGLWRTRGFVDSLLFNDLDKMRKSTRSEILFALRAAFDAGEVVQYKIKNTFEGKEAWYKVCSLVQISDDDYEYRLKPREENPEPKYVPFTIEDAEFVLGQCIRAKASGSL